MELPQHGQICGISKASVQRVWHANGLKPHLLKTFKLSNDPQFIEKLEDVVGLYRTARSRARVMHRRKEPDSALIAGSPSPDEEGTRRNHDA